MKNAGSPEHNQSLNKLIFLVLVVGAAFVVCLTLLLRQASYNRNADTTEHLGNSTYQADPRAGKDQEITNSHQTNILNAASLGKHLSPGQFARLQRELREKFYAKTGQIPSLASVESSIRKTHTGDLTFEVVTDVDKSKKYTLFVGRDGSLFDLKEAE